MSTELGDTVLLKDHPGEWEITFIFTDEFNEKYDGKYGAVRVSMPDGGFTDNAQIKLKDEHIKEVLTKSGGQ